MTTDERLGFLMGRLDAVRWERRAWSNRHDTPEQLREDMRGLLERLKDE